MGLSEPVAAAVDAAVTTVEELIREWIDADSDRPTIQSRISDEEGVEP